MKGTGVDTSVQDLDAVSFVLGEGQPFVKWDELTVEEKRRIVGRVVERVRPLLAQMPGFKTLREQLLDSDINGDVSLLEDLWVSSNWDWDRRCRHLISLGTYKSENDAVVIKKTLYADQAGCWFVVSASYRASNRNSVVLPWPFEVRVNDCDAREVRDIAANHGREVCQAMLETVSLAIKFWSKRIQSCSELKDWIGEVKNRLV